MNSDNLPPVTCVLLVDDEEADNFIHKRVIDRTGWVQHVHVVTDGFQALAYLKGEKEFSDRAKHPRPEIIFLDINMPRMDGYEFLAAYHELPDELKADVCVFMLSTLRSSTSDAKINEYPDVADFMTKPLDRESLRRSIQLAGIDLSGTT